MILRRNAIVWLDDKVFVQKSQFSEAEVLQIVPLQQVSFNPDFPAYAKLNYQFLLSTRMIPFIYFLKKLVRIFL